MSIAHRRKSADFVVIGGGIVGLAIARELRSRYTDASIVVLEKESRCGIHASGRNSGVIHAGFYYSADSLKASLTRDGNRLLTEYCLDRGLGVNRCGKVVVASGPQDLPGIDELERRAKLNGVDLKPIDAGELNELEPRAATYERALFSPTTSSVDPREVVGAVVEDVKAQGVEVRTGALYTGRTGKGLQTPNGSIDGGYVVNAAGLYADRVARDFGFGEAYEILPFKGLYLYAEGMAESPIRKHIYPVPDLAYPFLGVHFTVTVAGQAKIGPTAMPAFWRENYRGLAGLRLGELRDIVLRQSRLFLRDEFSFRRLARTELQKAFRSNLVRQSMRLVRDWPDNVRWRWGAPGIRAQLLDRRTSRLVMDFCVEGDDRSMHVLNAVSPAFTCAFSFARLVVDRIEENTGSVVRDVTSRGSVS